MKEFGQDRTRQKISIWQYDITSQTDMIFIKDFATPYFSEVYQSLMS